MHLHSQNLHNTNCVFLFCCDFHIIIRHRWWNRHITAKKIIRFNLKFRFWMTYVLFIGKINCNKIDATRVIPFDRFWYVAFDLHLTPFAIFFYSNFVMKFVKFDANPFMRFDATWLVCIAYSLNKHHSVYFGVDAPISLTFKTKLYFKTVPIFIRLCVWKRDKFKKKIIAIELKN